MTAAEPSGAASSIEDVRAAYIYLLGRVLVVRQEWIDAGEDGFAYNRVKYNPLGSAEFVNPNLDVAYLETWFAADDDNAVLLQVPEIAGRYYTAQILDEWGEVIVNINDRATPAKPFGVYALTKPGSRPDIPAGAIRVELHSAKAKMLARVELQRDPDVAVELQHQFTVTAPDSLAVAAPPDIPQFDNATLLGADIFDHAEAVLASALDVSPVAARMQLLVRAIAADVASGAESRAHVDDLLRTRIVPDFVAAALTTVAPYRNHWTGGGVTGNYGTDYTMRTMANYAGIWANAISEVIYFLASRDSTEQPLDGGNSYTITFPADDLPDGVVDGYWSIILVDVPDFRVVDNPLHRYNLNSYSPLERADDGSLVIGIGPQVPPGVPEANWLPPAPGHGFALTTRFYVPTDTLLPPGGTWTPPPVTPPTVKARPLVGSAVEMRTLWK